MRRRKRSGLLKATVLLLQCPPAPSHAQICIRLKSLGALGLDEGADSDKDGRHGVGGGVPSPPVTLHLYQESGWICETHGHVHPYRWVICGPRQLISTAQHIIKKKTPRGILQFCVCSCADVWAKVQPGVSSSVIPHLIFFGDKVLLLSGMCRLR